MLSEWTFSRLGLPKSCGPHSFQSMKYSFMKLRVTSLLHSHASKSLELYTEYCNDPIECCASHHSRSVTESNSRISAPVRSETLTMNSPNSKFSTDSSFSNSSSGGIEGLSKASSDSICSFSGWSFSAASGASNPHVRCSFHVSTVARKFAFFSSRHRWNASYASIRSPVRTLLQFSVSCKNIFVSAPHVCSPLNKNSLLKS